MPWRSDELGHRSAERSGWVAELRAADPETVDETIDGAVEYAAATDSPAERDASGFDQQEVVDPTTVAGPRERDALTVRCEPTAVADGAGARAEMDQSDRRCAFCADPIEDDEPLDADGVPVPIESDFEWIGDASLHHKECLQEGEGRFLPWTANGVLGDEAAE